MTSIRSSGADTALATNISSPVSARFRPASLDDFKTYARSLADATGLKLQAAQELLAKLYGYSGLHELQVELTKPGVAGPFDDDPFPAFQEASAEPEMDVTDELEPGGEFDLEAYLAEEEALLSQPYEHVFTWERLRRDEELSRTRRRTRRLQQLFRHVQGLPLDHDGSTEHGLAGKVLELGLFCSPVAQRERVHALKAPNSQAWPAGMWGMLKSLYLLPYDVAGSIFNEPDFQIDPEDDGADYGKFSPVRMLAEIQKQVAPAMYLALTGKLDDELEGFVKLWDFDDVDLDVNNWMNQNSTEDQVEHWTYQVVTWAKKRMKASGAKPKAPSEDELNQIRSYLTNPSEEDAARNRFLHALPAMKLAQQWRSLELRAAAKDVLKSMQRNGYALALSNSQLMSVLPQEPTESVRCFVRLSKVLASDPSEHCTTQMWECQATFVVEPREPNSEAIPLGSLYANIICPAAYGVASDNSEFCLEADSYSQSFCTLAEVVIGKYLPKTGYLDMEQFCVDTNGHSFADVGVFLEPAFTGHNLMAPLLSLWLDTLRRYTVTRVDAVHSKALPPVVLKALRQFYAKTSKWFQPPGVLLLDVNAREIRSASSNRLIRHLMSIRSDVPAEVVIYDFSEPFEKMSLR